MNLTKKSSLTEKIRSKDSMYDLGISLNLTEIALQIYQNLPEASISLVCTKWNYGYIDKSSLEGEMDPKLFAFEFLDDGEDKKYSVKIKRAEKGIKMLIDNVASGKNKAIGAFELFDLGNWDAEIVDMCVQYAIFGELVYG